VRRALLIGHIADRRRCFYPPDQSLIFERSRILTQHVHPHGRAGGAGAKAQGQNGCGDKQQFHLVFPVLTSMWTPDMAGLPVSEKPHATDLRVQA
jgi:hypothetical protein